MKPKPEKQIPYVDAESRVIKCTEYFYKGHDTVPLDLRECSTCTQKRCAIKGTTVRMVGNG
jgi:putative component of membrane protein insertase Oxa1/YidC/SpoIIIJ protein YidD